MIKNCCTSNKTMVKSLCRRDPLRPQNRKTQDHRFVKESEIVNLVEKITKSQIRTDIPEFRAGDTVRVDVKIIEGKRERIQAFEGIVISIQGSGVGKNFIVRKISGGVGVERTFPMNSPKVASVTVVRKGKVRQAKIGAYLRKSAKQPRIKERN